MYHGNPGAGGNIPPRMNIQQQGIMVNNPANRNIQFAQQPNAQVTTMNNQQTEMQPGVSPQQPRPAQPQRPPAQPSIDLATQIKQLIAELKEVLNNLILSATRNFYANAAVDNLEKGKGKDSDAFRFDKSFEQFHALCNQIERAIFLQLHQIHQTLQTSQQAMTSKTNEAHNEYLAIAKLQIQTSKEIHDALYETLLKLKKNG